MVLTLVLIPYIIAHNGRRTPNGESASKFNIQESFINIYKNLEDFNNWTKNNEGSNDYEYVIRFLRVNRFITQTNYNINEYTFKYTDPMEAFVNLFAKIMVLNMKFPKICNHVWQFIQQGIFGIPIERSVMIHTAQKALRTVNF